MPELVQNFENIELKNKNIVKFLNSSSSQNKFSFLEKLKINFRPYICPFQKILNLIDNNSKVFEIGCGMGLFMALVLKFKNPKEIFGIEISPRLVNSARTYISSLNLNKSFQVEMYDGGDFPECIKNFSTIVMIDVFHHIEKNKGEKFLENIYNSMSSGSTLMLKDIDAADRFFLIFNKIHDLIISKEIGNEISLNNAEYLIIKSGFKVKKKLKIRTYLYSHYVILAEK
ncbi:class I SAM-dependent methyltransferase [Fluviispira multicolorata]|uniref:Methyltransferase n=1 Tax=Fluviispira multicolorata TaxID=2654512 RepID=A0A833JB25_9BACT|nr:class I SAM-dependent methyltransferase [Fluviispira multicolorata]KAB8028008.1 methyltransferase [Fluviispira multicolorata]